MVLWWLDVFMELGSWTIGMGCFAFNILLWDYNGKDILGEHFRDNNL